MVSWSSAVNTNFEKNLKRKITKKIKEKIVFWLKNKI